MSVVVASQVTSGGWRRRFTVTPAVELLALLIAIAVAVVSYLVISGQSFSQRPLTPPLVAGLLVANLLCCGSLIVLVGRRVARQRAAREGTAGGGELHVRLVAIFSVLAVVPTVLLAVVASLLFQFGAEFWSSGKARSVVESSRQLALDSYAEMLRYVDNENVALASDVRRMVVDLKLNPDSKQVHDLFFQSAYFRSLSSAVLFSVDEKGGVHWRQVISNSDRDPRQDVDPKEITRLLQGAEQSVANTNAERTHSIARVLDTNLFVYATREGGAKEMAQRLDQTKRVYTDYRALLERTRVIQLRFNIALLVISLIVIMIVVVAALAVADRLVRPVGELVTAAQRIASGDLAARVPAPARDDEIGTLANAFNRMTETLQQQNGALVTANEQIESRRALIEAVLSGVTAGVISTAPDGTVRLINQSATALLHTGDASALGRPLAEIAPELASFVAGDDRDGIVEIGSGAEARTLAVKITRATAGPVLTFDDITQQLLDQRRAAWSDVARRIAHEIKNPLTPIQLAAERLQRRYAKQIDAGDGTFARLTETIVRQVGDLRRMVDEFSSFARMPKPVFREESLLDIARQALFLQEVAHSGVKFTLVHDDEMPPFVCDRRQMGQALTNVVKNAVEAIEAKGDNPVGTIVMTLRNDAPHIAVIELADNGIGLPAARDRLVEPYVTTRARGTGLGLAIVKKIVEEHFGTMSFADREGGGTVVTMCFDTAMLASLDTGDGDAARQAGADARLPELTRNRTE